jgi:GH35 family endo-1,4-beta-xylanase
MSLKIDGNDPYYRSDPGTGFLRIPAYKFNIEKDFSQWKFWRTNDGRILPNRNSNFELVDNPFDPGSLVLLTTNFDPSFAGKPFGGFGVRIPINPAVTINDQTFIEFDLYYTSNAVDKYMRFELWSTSTSGEGLQADSGSPGSNRTQYYIRTGDLESIGKINPGWIGFYKGETWFKKPVCAVTPVTSGIWEYLNIDIHTETGTKVTNNLLLIGNIRITQMDPGGVPIPEVVNDKSFNEVTPIKEKFNEDNGHFFIGTIGTGPAESDTIRGYHYEIFVGENDLKPNVHVSPPQWLKDKYPDFVFKTKDAEIEWNFATGDYLGLRDSGKNGEFKIHGHCLAWNSQSPPWMRQLTPENVTTMQWNSNGLFYSGGNNATGPYLKIDKETARRIYFNHIMYVLRHFMTTDTRYDSSIERGIIPFHSFDVLNVEIHESRHIAIIHNDANGWKAALKNTSWLMAMTDNDFDDIRQHYVYLLFKYAHMAIPNAQMAERYKMWFHDANVIPEYMKLDNHDKNGSIDAYVNAQPPILICNEYDTANYSKTKVACNMIREINSEWKVDPLYDGRNLIECMGIQGHETVGPEMVSKNQDSVAIFTSLIDEGLLDRICYSEVDIKQPEGAPGGGALAPTVLNQKQADTIGYQYALLFRMFEKYKKYIDHVILWGQYGASYLSSYVPFDHNKMASQAYYGIMDPDKFISGHSYLDSYFAGEYEKIIKNN